jgi:hypothetical protein
MNQHELITGYKRIIHEIYTTKPYYKRIRRLLLNYKPHNAKPFRISFTNINAFLKSIFIIGVLKKGRIDYWKFLIWTLFKKPGAIVDAIEYTIYGYHYRTVFGLGNKVKS